MPTNWTELDDEGLRQKAQRGQEPAQVANVEAMRRFRNSIDAMRQSTDTWG